LPDLDTLTLLGGWRFYRTYHRIVGHGLPLTLVGPTLLALLGAALSLGPFLPLWGWLQGALVVYLLTDVCFYRWPVQLLWPLWRRGWGFGLVRWNDLVPTLVLYAATAMTLVWQSEAFAIAVTGLGALFSYLVWRAWRPEPEEGWGLWLTGGWALESARPWRWLTGDFMS
jgi:hypothetical protein